MTVKGRIKRILTIFLAVFLVVGGLPVSVHGEEIRNKTVSGDCEITISTSSALQLDFTADKTATVVVTSGAAVNNITATGTGTLEVNVVSGSSTVTGKKRVFNSSICEGYTVTVSNATGNAAADKTFAAEGETVNLSLRDASVSDFRRWTFSAGISATSEKNCSFSMPSKDVRVTPVYKTSLSGAEITLTPENFSFDGSNHSPAVSVVLNDSTLTEGVAYSLSGETSASAGGTHTITVTGINDYKDTATKTWTISSGSIRWTDGGNVEVPYDGALHGITVNVTAPATAEVLWSDSENGSYSATELKYQDAGTYPVWYKVHADGYADTVPVQRTITITPKPVTVSTRNQTIKYGDAPNLSVSVAGDAAAAACLTGQALCSYSAGQSVGTYRIDQGSIGFTSNNYTMSYQSGTVTVVPKLLSKDTMTINLPSIDAETVTGGPWTTSLQVMNGSTELTKDMDYTVRAEDLTVTDWDQPRATLTKNVTIRGIGNYTGTAVAAWTLTDNVIPTGAVLVLNRSWNDEVLSAITFGLYDKPAQTVRITASDSGSGVARVSYYVTDTAIPGDTTAEVKAALDQVSNWTELTLDAMNEGSFSLTDADRYVIYAKIVDKAGKINYISSNGFTLDDTAPVLTGIEDGSTYYADQTLTVTDDVGLAEVQVNGEVQVFSAGALSFTKALPVGGSDTQYVIRAEDLAGNTVQKTIQINPKREITVSAQSYSVPYDGLPHGIAVQVEGVTASAFKVRYQTVDGSWSETAPVFTEVGNHDVCYRVDALQEQYSDVAAATATVIITKARLVVTPDSGQEKSYRTEDPEALTYRISGFVNGETAAAVSGKIARAAGEDAGMYLITAGSLNASNYEITMAADPVYFTIRPKNLSSDDITVSLEAEKEYTGAEITNLPVVRDGTMLLTEDTDYILSGHKQSAWSAGGARYNAVITGKGNYTGILTLPWAIVDTVQPACKIFVKEQQLMKALHQITFGKYFNETTKITIQASDAASGVAKVEYLLLHKQAEGGDEATVRVVLNAKTGWTEIANGDSFTLDPNEDVIVYARVTDRAGNVLYASSDGLVLDNIPPVIDGVRDGGVYAHDVMVTVTDEHLSSVKVDGVSQSLSRPFTIKADGSSHKIVATDRAGNVSTALIVLYTSESDNGTTDSETHEKGMIVSEVNYGPDTPKMAVKGFNAKVAKNLCTIEELNELKTNATQIDVFLDVIRIEGATLPANDEALVEKAAKKWSTKAKFPMYLDISLYKQNGSVHKLSSSEGHKFAMTLTVPSDLRPKDASVTRTYAIYRVHDGVAKQLAVSQSPKLSFKTDKFSTYALVYTDSIEKDAASEQSGPSVPAQITQPTQTPQTPSQNLQPMTAQGQAVSPMLTVAGNAPQQVVQEIQGETGKTAQTAAGTKTIQTADGVNAPETGDNSNMPVWIAMMVLLISLTAFLTLFGRNYGLFPYPTTEYKNRVVRRLCDVGNHHKKLRYPIFFVIVGFVFMLNVYKHLFFSDAARKTYAKA